MNILLEATAGILLASLVGAFDVTKFEDIAAAKKTTQINIKDLQVPAGVQLDLTNLLPGTVITFSGHVTFGYAIWDGPLVKISGKNVRIQGKPGSMIDADGRRWWDGKGGNGGKKKLRFFEIQLSDSVITDLYVKNPPAWCFISNGCSNLLINNVTIDAKDGDRFGGHNTDGFGVGFSNNVTIRNSYVHNQDDCFCTGHSTNVVFENNVCVGGHGISIGSMGSGRKVENLIVRNCKVQKSDNGIRIKTRTGETGLVKNVRFENIELKDISRYGIVIQSNYRNSGPKGPPTPFPIEDIVVNNVHGHVSRKGINVLVWVNPGSAKNWSWKADVTGGQKETKCMGIPNGLNFPCGKK